VVNRYLSWLVYGSNIIENVRLFFLIATVQLFISIIITGVFYVKQYFNAWLEASVNEERLRYEAIALQYDALKSNISPHFLFNSLSVLDSLVEEDTVKAQKFIRGLPRCTTTY
jgi:two-component system, LytTR family, sensor kinase